MKGPTKSNREKKVYKVAVIGSGCNGKEAAIALSKRGHRVFVFEAGSDGPAGTTTKYSCHAHPTGSHYNRLPEKYIRFFIENYSRFKAERGKYLKANPNSIHGIVHEDAYGRPSRTSAQQFKERSKFDTTARPINPEDFGLHGFQEPIAINEERIVNGEELKEQYRLDFLKQGVNFYYDTPVKEISRVKGGYSLKVGDEYSVFDKVVNATGFQKFIPHDFANNPFGLDVKYQPVVGLLYEDTKADEKDIFSLLLLDGANPCLMPTANANQYILTHCGYTLLASCNSPDEAWNILNSVTVDFIQTQVKPKSEADLMRYVNDFHDRFRPIGYNGGVIAKPNTENEFRLAFAFASPDYDGPVSKKSANGIIHVFPGKITSSLRAADEVVRLVEEDDLCYKDGYKYPRNGMLDIAAQEIKNKPASGSNLHNACAVNPYPELIAVNKTKSSDYATNPNSMWNNQQTSATETSQEEKSNVRYFLRSRRDRSNSELSDTSSIGRKLIEVSFTP